MLWSQSLGLAAILARLHLWVNVTVLLSLIFIIAGCTVIIIPSLYTSVKCKNIFWVYAMEVLLSKQLMNRSFCLVTDHLVSCMFCHWTSSFYRTMLCIRGTSHGPVSVCLSVTSWCSTKTAKRRITQTTPHDSPGTLVSWRQRSLRNSTGVTPNEGAECRCGGSKSATFDQ